MGWIRFEDQRGVIREMGFCRRWDASERRFVIVDNPDYEYEA
jgi:hypothetical protein